MDRLPAVASIAAEGRGGGCNIPNQLVRCRVLPRSVTCLSGRWHSYWHCLDTVRSELCGSDRCDGGCAYDDSVHRDPHLLGTRCSHLRLPVGRLDASDRGDPDFHWHTESGGILLCAAHCGQLRWLTSDDRDRVDLCLGSDYCRGNGSAACRAAYRNAEGPVRTLCLGPAFAETISADRNGSQIQRNRSVESVAQPHAHERENWRDPRCHGAASSRSGTRARRE